MASDGLSLSLKRNTAWKPNGPADYARSARKWGIKPTEQTTFFVHENTLKRRGVEHTEHHHGGTQEHKHKQGGGGTGTGTGSGAGTGTGSGTSTAGVEVPAADVQNDLEYVVPVTVGTPGETLNLDFDTGSADLWVWSTLLKTTTANSGSHTIYDPTKSSTAKKETGLTWNISYGDGSSASGSVYSDTVTLGGSLSVPNQAVEAASKLSSAFLTSTGSDGLLGLAFPTINTVSPTQAATPVENMISQNLIAQPLFTVKLDKEDSKGFYTFGYIDNTVLPSSSTITYADIDSSNGFWEFQSPELVVNGKAVARASGNTAIADTGTTLILLDDAAVQAIYSTIPGAKLDNTQGGWTIPSSSTSSLPTIGFSVAGTVYNIAGEDLLFADGGNGTYFGAIQSRGQNPQDILGDVFLKRVYAIFDQTTGSPRIGFGQRALV